MVRIDAVSYGPEGVSEETDITVGRCRELVEKHGVTWIDIVDMEGRTREELEADQVSLFLAKRYLMTIHDKVLPQLEDVKVRMRKKDPKILKSGPDFLLYMVLDAVVDSYFPHLDRLDDIIEGLEEAIVRDPTKASLDRIHSVRTDLLKLRNAL